MVVKAKGYERQQLAAKMVDTLKASSGDLLKEVQKAVQRRAFLRVQKEFFENTLPAPNTQPVFHVKDLTLDEDKTFDDSRYCIDWKTIDENKGFKGLYNSDELITPMRFGENPEPVLLPMVWQDTLSPRKPSINKKENYYTYKDTFLPGAQKGTEVVYTCTLYHYMMMGAPKEMLFRDVSDKYSQAFSVPFTVPQYEKGDKVIDVWIEIPGNDYVWELQALAYTEDHTYVYEQKPGEIFVAEGSVTYTRSAGPNSYVYDVDYSEDYNSGIEGDNGEDIHLNGELPGAVVADKDMKEMYEKYRPYVEPYEKDYKFRYWKPNDTGVMWTVSWYDGKEKHINYFDNITGNMAFSQYKDDLPFDIPNAAENSGSVMSIYITNPNIQAVYKAVPAKDAKTDKWIRKTDGTYTMDELIVNFGSTSKNEP